MTLTSDLGGHVTNEVPDSINRGKVTFVAFPGAQKCPNLDFNKLRSKVTMTSEVKGQGHFIFLFFMAQVILWTGFGRLPNQ